MEFQLLAVISQFSYFGQVNMLILKYNCVKYDKTPY